MLLKDEAEVEVCAGRGGDGCCSFRREKYVPRGGPDGGDGGDGGDVVFVADVHINSLLPLYRARRLTAENGRQGSSRNKHGRNGEDLEVKVPVGSLFYDRQTGELLADLDREGARFVAARGGHGGRGNDSFKSPTNQTPREFEEGEPGERAELRVELKLMADVGLVGLPNAGKSTFLGKVSGAHPKIAAYPFTTLAPELGVVELPGYRRLVVADIPGLIEGAHEGHGLGDQFLRHIERCGLLLHLVDLSAGVYDPDAPAAAYRTIRGELAAFSQTLADKPELVVGNKVDVEGAREHLASLSSEVGAEVEGISAVTGDGVQPLLEELHARVKAQRAAEAAAAEAAAAEAAAAEAAAEAEAASDDQEASDGAR